MSHMPKQKSGSQKRKERDERQQKEEKLLEKIPKLTSMFAPQQAIASVSDNPRPHDIVEIESASGHSISEGGDGSDLSGSDFFPSSSSMQIMSESDPSFTAEKETVSAATEFCSDPALWVTNDEKLKDHLTSIKFPDRNIQPNFPQSRRLYPDKCRFLSKDLFQYTMANGETVQRDWLIYSKSKGSVYCFVCKLFSNKKSYFSTGFNDWKHANVRHTEHGNSNDHFIAQKIWITRRNSSSRIDSALLTQFETEYIYWTNVLRRVVVVIKFLSERGLALKGDNNQFGSPRNGNYLGALELLAQFDPFLAKHIEIHGNKGKGHPSYLSLDICDEFIHCMVAKVSSIIVEEIKQSK